MDTAPACAPRHCSARWTLSDGRTVTVRAMQAGDLRLASDFVARGLTQKSRYQRFQSGMQELPSGMAAYFTDVDLRQHVALLALADGDGPPRQVGDARYVCDGAAPGHAEFALAVADDWQRVGLGARMLRQLQQLARQQGLRGLYGDMLRTNAPMLALARSQGFAPQPQEEARLVRMARSLDASAAGAVAGTCCAHMP